MNKQDQELVFLGVSQLASKSVVSMEELRQQIGERLPQAMGAAARSMNMTVPEFNKLVESGQLLAEDFLPKFAQQLSAESATGVAGAADQAGASVNRFSNALYDLQVGLGKELLPARSLGLDAMAKGMEVVTASAGVLGKVLGFVTFNAISNVIKASIAAAQASIATAGGFNAILAMLASLRPVIVAIIKQFMTLAKQFVLFYAATEVVSYVISQFQDAGGAIRDFAKDATKGMEEYRKALAEARGEQEKLKSSMPKTARDLQGGGQGGIQGFIDRGIVGTQKFLGLKTSAEKRVDDKSIAVDDLLNQVNASTSQIYSQVGINGKGAGDLTKLKALDSQLNDVQQKRRAAAITQPKNDELKRQLSAQEEGLLKQRETLSKPIAALQANNAANIEQLKGTLKALNEDFAKGGLDQETYNAKTAAVAQSLEAAQRAQTAFNSAVKDAINDLSSLDKNWQSIVDKLQDANTALDVAANKAKASLIRSELGGQRRQADVEVERTTKEESTAKDKLAQNQKAIAELKAELEIRKAGKVLEGLGVTDKTGPAELKTLADRVQGPKEKSVLSKMAELRQLEGESSALDVGAAEAANNKRKAIEQQALSDIDRNARQQEAIIKRSEDGKIRAIKQRQLIGKKTEAEAAADMLKFKSNQPKRRNAV